MKLVLERFLSVRGAVVGRLNKELSVAYDGTVDYERICDTVEREGGNLPPGEYRVVIAKCPRFYRKMLFLVRDKSASSEASSSEGASSSKGSSSEGASSSKESSSKEPSSEASSSKGCKFSSSPTPSVCKRCKEERKHHEFGHLAALHSIPCGMMQPGNGPFTLRQGGILIGEAHPPGFVLKSQSLFLLLYDRINKVLGSGGEVRVVVK